MGPDNKCLRGLPMKNEATKQEETSAVGGRVDTLVMCNCPLCGAPRDPKTDHRWTKGLSVRAANALIHDGVQSKDEVLELMKVRNGLLRIMNVGRALKKEIEEWAST
jgi:hypothetical protein